MSLVVINFWYVIAAALFIFGLKKLGSPDSAVFPSLAEAASVSVVGAKSS
jgi:NAD/NADP transhydrogenase beta subunit